MMDDLPRRRMLAALAVPPTLAGAGEDDPITAIERQHGGRLGVLALDTGSGRRLAHRADERFMMFSTFKGVLAAEVLADIGLLPVSRTPGLGVMVKPEVLHAASQVRT